MNARRHKSAYGRDRRLVRKMAAQVGRWPLRHLHLAPVALGSFRQDGCSNGIEIRHRADPLRGPMT